MIVYVSIGNSDDKLSQMEWGRFYRKVDLTIQGIRRLGGSIIGRWVSQSTDYWQNACWCIDISDIGDDARAKLMFDLASLGSQFRQDSIAWAPASTTQFLSISKTEAPK